MKVFTHYAALAPAIKRAGYEPVLLEPLDVPPGPVKAVVTTMCGITLLEVSGLQKCFEKTPEGWELVR